MTYEVTLEKTVETLTTALEVIRELQEQNRKLTAERDMHKELKDIESHRIGIATDTIKEYEAELGMDNEHSLYDPHDSPQKQERKAKTHRKWRCIEYLNKEHGYNL